MVLSAERRVLIVEDSEIFRDVLRNCLRSSYPGVCILEAGCVADGRRLAHQHVPALILMDVQLPDGNGIELTRALKAEMPGVKIVICTSYDLAEHRKAAFECGADHFVCKDRLTESGLMGLVGRLLELRPAETPAHGERSSPRTAEG